VATDWRCYSANALDAHNVRAPRAPGSGPGRFRRECGYVGFAPICRRNRIYAPFTLARVGIRQCRRRWAVACRWWTRRREHTGCKGSASAASSVFASVCSRLTRVGVRARSPTAIAQAGTSGIGQSRVTGRSMTRRFCSKIANRSRPERALTSASTHLRQSSGRVSQPGRGLLCVKGGRVVGRGEILEVVAPSAGE